MIPYYVIDTHCDTLTMLDAGQSLLDCPKHYNLKKQAQYARFLQVMDLWVDCGEHEVASRVDSYIDFFYQEMERVEAQSAQTGISVMPILNGVELQQHFTQASSGKQGWLLGIEGGECIGNSLERLQALFDRGVRLITLTWNTPNAISDTNVTRRPGQEGLTSFGREVVREMNRLGMVIDVSHISDTGFWDVLEETQKPVMASHSNARAVCAHSRNLTDAMFDALVANGGVAGMNFCTEFLGGTEDLEQIVRHIEYFAARGGIHHIGIGSDFDGIDALPGGIQGTESLYRIFDRLLQLNYKDEEVEAISWRNTYRVLTEVLPGA